MTITRILIANRGEIACRIIQTCRAEQINTVAIYSEADANASHVALADEAYCVGPAPSQESYLNAEAILAVAQQTGAQAIHPGYGFLSENESFAKACADAGIIFIGPSPAALAAMASKSAAKTIMEGAGVPLLPGYHGSDQSFGAFESAANDIGYPVLVKATAGGGGKGMRIVHSAKDLQSAIDSAKREAIKSFGDDTLLIEKYLERPRHVELQVLGDNHGNVVHVFERDCSIQRRHQKVLEEAPAPHLSEDLRATMGQAAVDAAKAIDYTGAGTIEFLLDDAGQFYFMEMNTRLQVEHPVTEFISGLDLVSLQIQIAEGQPLPFTQAELTHSGHAFEARIYAEKPEQDFLPAIGQLTLWAPPPESERVRVDTGVQQGDHITPHYDPMLAKLIAWGEDRQTALDELRVALMNFHVDGLHTNLPFLRRVCGDSDFAAGDVHTHFINEHPELVPSPASPTEAALLCAGVYLSEWHRAQEWDLNSPWATDNGWRMNGPASQWCEFTYGENHYRVTLLENTVVLSVNGTAAQPLAQLNQAELNGHWLTLNTEAGPLHASCARVAGGLEVNLLDESIVLALPAEQQQEQVNQGGDGQLSAPMPGTVVAVMAESGKQVEAGAGLMVIEAMKMEHTIVAPSQGKVVAVHFNVGDQVDEGVELVSFEVA